MPYWGLWCQHHSSRILLWIGGSSLYFCLNVGLMLSVFDRKYHRALAARWKTVSEFSGFPMCTEIGKRVATWYVLTVVVSTRSRLKRGSDAVRDVDG